MNNIDIPQIINQLLFRYDCVIIPGFGGFVSNYHSARYHTDDHVFVPPSKQLAFNSNLTVNDGLLANAIARVADISFYEATLSIGQFVNAMQHDLEAGKSVFLPFIGTFERKQTITLFEPDTSLNRLMEAFGLPALTMPFDEMAPASFIPRTARTSGRILAKTMVVLPLLLLLAVAPLKMTHFQSNSSFTTKLLNVSWSVSNPKTSIPDNTKSLSDVIESMTSAEVALRYQEPVRTKVNPTLVAETPTPQPAKKSQAEPVISEKPAKKFYVIAGSFTEMFRVRKFCTELDQAGVSSEVLKMNDKLRISVLSFTDAAAADQGISEFRNQHPDYPVWLLKI